MHSLTTPARMSAGRRVAVLWALGTVGLAAAQNPPITIGPQAPNPMVIGPQAPASKIVERSISEWLVRMHEASRLRSYIGTFVVLSNTGAMSSARIW
ncbi:MAG: sigma-E factor regulatory protein RseB domain-containing protein, partial [Ramlibacter sp.]